MAAPLYGKRIFCSPLFLRGSFLSYCDTLCCPSSPEYLASAVFSYLSSVCTKKLWMDSGKIHIGFSVDADFENFLRVWTSQLFHSWRTLSSSNVWRTISRPGHLTGIPFSIIILPCMCAFLHASRIWAGCTWTLLIICSVRFGFLASSFYLHQAFSLWIRLCHWDPKQACS